MRHSKIETLEFFLPTPKIPRQHRTSGTYGHYFWKAYGYWPPPPWPPQTRPWRQRSPPHPPRQTPCGIGGVALVTDCSTQQGQTVRLQKLATHNIFKALILLLGKKSISAYLVTEFLSAHPCPRNIWTIETKYMTLWTPNRLPFALSLSHFPIQDRLS